MRAYPQPQNSLRLGGAEVLRKFRENPSSHIDRRPITRLQSNVLGFAGGGEYENHSMEKDWRVSHVELLEGGLLYGFVLYDQKGRPCVSFGYADDRKANVGRDHVEAALKGVEQVLGRRVVKLITIEAA